MDELDVLQNSMKITSIRLLAIAALTGLYAGFVHAHEPPDHGEVKVIHTTKYDGAFLRTTNEHIWLFSKEDPTKAKPNDVLNLELCLSWKIAKESGAVLVMHSDKDKNESYIGEFRIVGHEKKNYEKEGTTAKGFSFAISKQYFDNAIVRIWYGDKDFEEIELHFHPPKESKEAEQAGTGQPATRPELKSEGDDKPQPESEGRSR